MFIIPVSDAVAAGIPIIDLLTSPPEPEVVPLVGRVRVYGIDSTHPIMSGLMRVQ